MSYDVHIPRCTHIKTNGTQCGSPALRGRRFCFFHKNWQGQRVQLNAPRQPGTAFTLPVLEDADSIQVALMQVLGLILGGQIEPKMAGLLLYGLQTASLNLRGMKLEPGKKEDVVVNPAWTRDTGVGDDAWCEEDFEEEEQGEDLDSDKEQEGDGDAEEAVVEDDEVEAGEYDSADQNTPRVAARKSPSTTKSAPVIRERIQKAVRGALADGRLPGEGALPTGVQRSAPQPPAAAPAARSSAPSPRATSPKNALVVDLDADAMGLFMLRALVEAGFDPTEFEGWERNDGSF